MNGVRAQLERIARRTGRPHATVARDDKELIVALAAIGAEAVENDPERYAGDVFGGSSNSRIIGDPVTVAWRSGTDVAR